MKSVSEIRAAVRACTCKTYLSVSDRRAAGDIVPRRCRGLRGIQGLGVPPTDHPKQSATHRGLQAELMRQVERQTLTSQGVISRRRRRQGAGLRRPRAENAGFRTKPGEGHPFRFWQIQQRLQQTAEDEVVIFLPIGFGK
ncbi:hypothetical protein C0Q70_10341 [Pomacea canaliculata]|uniref:Uncharacterized protein n=1 Tax=Pomacea canaliculata TaxID=400727 RepID=A0A2T7PCC2_POMCA|nr:hypothetical protein C0Q70_10341 [Pomacea canaliculata]